MTIKEDKLILASQSPRRKKLIEQMEIPHIIHPSEIEEKLTSYTSVEDFASQLAELKAIDICEKHEGFWTLGSDTIVVLEDTILGKPANKEDAFRTLKRLSGRSHFVITAFSLCKYNGTTIEKHTTFDRTEVFFSELSDDEILDYVESGSPLDKAGSYGIQDDRGALFVEKIIGDFYSVMGLPIQKLYRELKLHAPNLLVR